MKNSLQLKLSQHLTLTPQLQQSIKLLQLSTAELNQELERYLLENPLLERVDLAGDAHEAPILPFNHQPDFPNVGQQENGTATEGAGVASDAADGRQEGIDFGGDGSDGGNYSSGNRNGAGENNDGSCLTCKLHIPLTLPCK